MGIPGVRQYLNKAYPHCVGRAEEGCGAAIDVLAVELNPLLHSACELSSDEGEVIRVLLLKLEEILRITLTSSPVPIHIGLFADGPPPIGKLTQQRERRARYALNGLQLSRLHLSPGTSFMGRALTAVKEYVAKICEGAMHITVSDADARGEGESKVIRWLRGLHGSGELLSTSRVCIVSPDHDLVLSIVAQPFLFNVAILKSLDTREVLHIGDILLSFLASINRIKSVVNNGGSPMFVNTPKSSVSKDEIKIPSFSETLLALKYDFLFLQTLRGTDCLPPISEYDPEATWSTYLQLKARSPHSSLISLSLSDDSLRIALNHTTFRKILKGTVVNTTKKKKAKPGGGGGGGGGGSVKGVLRALLSNHASMVTGVTPSYDEVLDGQGVSFAELNAYLKKLSVAIDEEDMYLEGLAVVHANTEGESFLSPQAHLAAVLPPHAFKSFLPNAVVDRLTPYHSVLNNPSSDVREVADIASSAVKGKKGQKGGPKQTHYHFCPEKNSTVTELSADLPAPLCSSYTACWKGSKVATPFFGVGSASVVVMDVGEGEEEGEEERQGGAKGPGFSWRKLACVSVLLVVLAAWADVSLESSASERGEGQEEISEGADGGSIG